MIAELFGTFGGIRIFESYLITVPFEDWSDVRSPSRAKRRMRQGHPQRIRQMRLPDPKAYQIDGAFHMHPATAKTFRDALASQASP